MMFTRAEPLWRVLAAVCVCGALSPLAAQGPAVSTRPAVIKPFTLLFDTGSPSAATLPSGTLAARTGWKLVPEDTVSHAFVGDAVFLNDKLAVAVRKGSAGAEVYSRTPAGLKDRAVLTLLAEANDPATSLTGVKIVENTQAAVALEATFKTRSGKGVSVTYRLTAGVTILELSTGDGAGNLAVEDKARYVVVPNYLSIDSIFGPKDPWTALPTENGYLSMLGQGEAILTCLWQGNERNADLLSDVAGAGRSIRGVRIECIKGKTVWVAVLEAPGIWQERTIGARAPAADVSLDWAPAFPAKWRAAVGEAGGELYADDLSGKPDPNSDHGNPKQPRCWTESNLVVVRASAMPGTGRQGVFMAYALDRAQLTPLTVFLPIDVMRNALGVGPCQYILDAEGLGSESPPTADQVTRWVEQLFERKKERKEADAIRRRLAEMVELMKLTTARLGRYREFEAGIPPKPADLKDPNANSDADFILRIIHTARTVGDSDANWVEIARQAAEGIVALIGKDNALTECRELGERIRLTGAFQDWRLAVSRKALCWVKARCRMAAAEHPELVEWATKVRRQTEGMLKRK
jgi:hypothetical protein